MKRKTYHDGAADERKSIVAYLRRKTRKWDMISGEETIRWLLERTKRYRKCAGGL